MRLPDFIRSHRDAIVGEWEAFAGTLRPAAGNMTRAELREHAAELLAAAADDLDRAQTRQRQNQKSKGRRTASRMALVAQNHAIQRLQAGFRLGQVLAEYRALRASVIRLWQDASPRPSAVTRRDLTRFHETIDEALTESVNRYVAQVDQYRDQFLALLGHDLRNSLAAISISASVVSNAADMKEAHAVRRILAASEQMTRMVNDLLDLTRTRLEDGIATTKQAVNLGTLCRQVIDELKAAHPGGQLLLECNGDLRGRWNRGRLAQIISSLVANALWHGDATKPVTIRAVAGEGTAVLTVHRGETIPSISLQTIFGPMAQSSQGHHQAGRLPNPGLGLFIVRELVNGDGGTVAVTSTDEGGTTFTVTLPRRDRSRRKRPHSATAQRRRRPRDVGAAPAAI